jgi:undecaprenyl-diphosphatase
MDPFFYFGAHYLYLLVPLIALWVFIKLPRGLKKRMLLNGALTLPLSYIVAQLAAALYNNPSPIDPLENGFPSDHTLLVAAIASVVWFYNKKVGNVLWVLVFVIALSRVYVGEHHLIDVLTSMVITFVMTRAVEKQVVKALPTYEK